MSLEDIKIIFVPLFSCLQESVMVCLTLTLGVVSKLRVSSVVSLNITRAQQLNSMIAVVSHFTLQYWLTTVHCDVPQKHLLYMMPDQSSTFFFFSLLVAQFLEKCLVQMDQIVRQPKQFLGETQSVSRHWDRLWPMFVRSTRNDRVSTGSGNTGNLLEF